MKCLFETPELMPPQLTEILDRWAPSFYDGFTYTEIAEMLKEVEAVGFTFAYYLDAEPYGLRPIGTPLNQLEGFENCNQ